MLKPPQNADDFALRIIRIMCHSRASEESGEALYQEILSLLKSGKDISSPLKRQGPAKWQSIWSYRLQFYDRYRQATDKLQCIERLPGIGPVSRDQVALAFGVPLDCTDSLKRTKEDAKSA
jgi:hypothetical protein